MNHKRKLDTKSDGTESDPEGLTDDEESPSGTDTEDEIAQAKQRVKSKKTNSRKRRATTSQHFGETLQSLLNTEAPSNRPLSLKPSVARGKYEEKVEAKAKKVLEAEKKEQEEVNHITDVIGGWGGESERTLRKVAQRGVISLFNIIQQNQSQKTTEVKKVPKLAKSHSKKINDSDDDENFLNMIRAGGVVSKT